MLKSLVQIGLGVCLCIFPGLAHAQKLEHAVLAYGSTGPNLTPFWVAREAGLHRHYGLDVDVVFFRGSTIAINALATEMRILAPSAQALLCWRESVASIRC